MKRWASRAAMALALILLSLTFVNASWIAPEPVGAAKLIAHRGLAQEFDRAGVDRDTCTATQIEQPFHDYLENTVRGVLRADSLGAAMVEIDIAPTADGEIVLFHDWMLDCRTDGSGDVREATLEELQALDIGYGYTADGGTTYPLRGTGAGAMPVLEEMLSRLRRTTRLMFNFKSGDAQEADLLAAKLRAAGRDPVASRDAFYGHEAPVAKVWELYPDVWAWNPSAAIRCSRDYTMMGWSGYVPQSCRGGTMVIPLNYQWAFWGWPNRLVARMEAYGGHVIVTGPYVDGEPASGLILPKQLEEIPDSFNGYVWIEDGFTILPALYPSQDNRTQAEIDAAQIALERRRAMQ